MSFPIQAKCQCGKTGYTLHSKPMVVYACHCKECQRLSTSPFSVTAFVNSNDVEFFGEMLEWNRPADSGNRNHAKFCASCGNRIYHFNPKVPERRALKLKPVDMVDDSIFQPQAHVWVSEKLSWVPLPEGIPCFDTQPT